MLHLRAVPMRCALLFYEDFARLVNQKARRDALAVQFGREIALLIIHRERITVLLHKILHPMGRFIHQSDKIKAVSVFFIQPMDCWLLGNARWAPRSPKIHERKPIFTLRKKNFTPLSIKKIPRIRRNLPCCGIFRFRSGGNQAKKLYFKHPAQRRKDKNTH